jgi:hypothetical protein
MSQARGSKNTKKQISRDNHLRKDCNFPARFAWRTAPIQQRQNTGFQSQGTMRTNYEKEIRGEKGTVCELLPGELLR